jgi:hypothetical protein
MTDRVCEVCGADVESSLEVTDEPAVYIVTPRYCDECLTIEEVDR